MPDSTSIDLVDFFFHDRGIDWVEIDFDFLSLFVGTVDFVTRAWLFELVDLVTKLFGLLLKVGFFHPFVLWLVCAVLFSESGDGAQNDCGSEDKIFHRAAPFDARGLSPCTFKVSG